MENFHLHRREEDIKEELHSKARRKQEGEERRLEEVGLEDDMNVEANADRAEARRQEGIRRQEVRRQEEARVNEEDRRHEARRQAEARKLEEADDRRRMETRRLEEAQRLEETKRLENETEEAWREEQV